MATHDGGRTRQVLLSVHKLYGASTLTCFEAYRNQRWTQRSQAFEEDSSCGWILTVDNGGRIRSSTDENSRRPFTSNNRAPPWIVIRYTNFPSSTTRSFHQYLSQATGHHHCVIKACRSRSKCRIPFQTLLQSKLILLSSKVLPVW